MAAMMRDLKSSPGASLDIEADETQISEGGDDGMISPTPAFPEGGLRAWATVLGAFLVQFCGFGYISAFGVFQDFYVRKQLTNESASSISWIGGIIAFLILASGLAAGRFYDRGYFYILHWSGTAIISFSLFMLSLTKENQFYQVFLAQGVGFGFGAGLIYVPSVAVVSHYFRVRRNFAMAIVASGSSLGAVVHPIMLNNTLDKLGFEKATRAHAGLVSGLMVISCLLIRTRLPPQQSPPLASSLVKFSRDKGYIACITACFFFIIGFYFPLFYLQLDAIKHGVDETFAFYSLVLLNAAAFLGRICSSFLIAPLGVENIVVVSTACRSILIFAMTGVSSVASVTVIALLYGFWSGILIALMAPFIANLADDISEIGLRMGIGFMLAGIGGLIGGPIEGALLTSDYHWWRAAVFSGIMASLGTACYTTSSIFSRRKRRKLSEEPP